MKYTVTVDGEVFEVEIGPGGRAWVNQEPYDVDLRGVGGGGQYSLLLDHRSYEVHVDGTDHAECLVMVGGRPYRARLRRGHRVNGGNVSEGQGGNGTPSRPRACSDVEMRAPLPGLLVEVRVSEGERVEEQDVVAVLESMKMNLELRAPRPGVVRELRVATGRQVAQDEVLAILDPKQDACP